jgi:hypothetical protein
VQSSWISRRSKETETACVDHNNAASMVKEPPKQSASLIVANKDAVIHIKMGELNEAHLLLSEAAASPQNVIREQQSCPKHAHFAAIPSF